MHNPAGTLLPVVPTLTHWSIFQADKAPELGKREKAPALSQSARAGLQVCFNSGSVWRVWAGQTRPSSWNRSLFYTFTKSTISSLPYLLFFCRSSLSVVFIVIWRRGAETMPVWVPRPQCTLQPSWNIWQQKYSSWQEMQPRILKSSVSHLAIFSLLFVETKNWIHWSRLPLQEVVCCRTFTKVSSERPRVKRKRNLTSVTSSCKFVDSTYSLFFHFFLFPHRFYWISHFFFFIMAQTQTYVSSSEAKSGSQWAKGELTVCWYVGEREVSSFGIFCQIKRTRDLAANLSHTVKGVNVVFAWQADR